MLKRNQLDESRLRFYYKYDIKMNSYIEGLI